MPQNLTDLLGVDLTPYWSILGDVHLLIVAALIGLGYFLQWSAVPNKIIPLVLVGVGILLSFALEPGLPTFAQTVGHAFAFGLIYAVLSVGLYGIVVRHIVDALAKIGGAGNGTPPSGLLSLKPDAAKPVYTPDSTVKTRPWIGAVRGCAAVLIAGCMTVGFMGCAGTVPTTYTDPNGNTVAYSASDEKIIKACATIEASLPTVRAGSSLLANGSITLAVPDPMNQAILGGQMWTVANGVYSLINPASPTLPSPASLKTTVAQFTDSTSTAATAASIANLASQLQGSYAAIYNQLTAAASATTNSVVKATILKTGLDALAALAEGVEDGTAKWKPVAIADAAILTRRIRLA